MSFMEFVVLLLVAAVCGAIGQALAGNSRRGWLVTIALGFIGALLGAWLSRKLGLPELFVIQIDDVAFPIVWSIIGAALFVALLTLLSRTARR